MREALAALRNEPALGEPLHRELNGLQRIRVGQLRLVYRRTGASLEVVAIGPRKTIYVDLEREARGEAL
ncbi:MAG: type II toxin-antitoxin system RelE/ParE family toxin [Chloroflexi bacterium]|nr:type II toxin-antitoxin system RelE/ParE family toxin [Chloroflexota bacterium]